MYAQRALQATITITSFLFLQVNRRFRYAVDGRIKRLLISELPEDINLSLKFPFLGMLEVRTSELDDAEPRHIADVLADLTLVNEGSAFEQRVRFDEHFADVFEPLSAGIANAIEIIGVREVDEEVCDISCKIAVVDTSPLNEPPLHKLFKESPERMRRADLEWHLIRASRAVP